MARDSSPLNKRCSAAVRLVTFLISFGLMSVSAQYRFDHWTTENGLPQNIITGIHQTPDGYLWIATLDGLARFDGVRFTVFNKTNTPGISNHRFFCLYGNQQGDLWLGTEVGTITRYHQGRFVTYGSEQGLPATIIRDIRGDAQGHIWALAGRTALEWDPANQRFSERPAPQAAGNLVSAGWSETAGFWRVDQAGLHLFIDGNWTLHALPPAAIIPLKKVGKLSDGTILMVTFDGRAFQLRGENLTPLPPQIAEDRLLADWRSLLGAVGEISTGKDEIRQLTISSSGQPLTLPNLNKLYKDRDGNLWLGFLNQGLYRIRRQIVTTYSQEQGLAGRIVYPVYEDHTGAIWAGSWDAGLSQIKDGKITTFTTRDGLATGNINSICEDRDGRLWISTTDDLQIYERGRFTSVKAQYTGGLPGGPVIFQDRSAAMWFGTGNGVIRHQGGQAQRYTVQDGLPSNVARVIIDAAAGGVWIGFHGGLAHWRDGQVKTWTEADGLPGNMIRSLYEDGDGVLWIGTYDSGLGRFKDGKFTRYTTREGLFNDGVFQILEDAFGYLWMSCNRGIYRVRKQELNEFAAGQRQEITAMAFGKSDGMLNPECNGSMWPAGVRARDGRLWFPTQDGVAMIDPAEVTTSQQPPPVLIEELRIDNNPVAIELMSPARRANSPIEIGPQQANFEIQYTALSFINSENLRFKYKLEGLDQDWVDAGTRRTAYFSHMAPGTYTFRVIAANSDGVWNNEGQSLPIRVLPPFYRTWWFLGLATLLAGGLAFGAYTYRVRQLKHRHALQQAFSDQLLASQESERARIAAGLHDSLGQQLLVIKNWAMIALTQAPPTPGAHEPLNEISTAASQAIEEVREVIYDLRPYQLDKIGLANTLRFMIEKVATVSGIEFEIKLDEIDEVFPYDKQVTFYRIVQECINNIVKHSQASRARVDIERHAQTILLKVEDNGCGFTPAATEASTRGGFGLTGLHERVRLLGGHESVVSAPGQGTRIQIVIALSHDPVR